jgi:hypothetical protein
MKYIDKRITIIETITDDRNDDRTIIGPKQRYASKKKKRKD